jgi:hypothetical protein
MTPIDECLATWHSKTALASHWVYELIRCYVLYHKSDLIWSCASCAEDLSILIDERRWKVGGPVEIFSLRYDVGELWTGELASLCLALPPSLAIRFGPELTSW